MNLPSILVVDDEAANFDVIEALLGEENYALQYASSGQEAFESLEILPIDLILLDVMMPEMDGIEVCSKIKANLKWQAIPIVMVTALTAKEELARCLNAGATDFLSKPVNGLELRARVQSMLRIKQQYDEIQKLQRDTINILERNLQELSGNIASSVPHEFNTPLNGILGGLELLIEDHKNMDVEEVHEWLQSSYKSAIRLNDLTKKFLTYTQLEIKIQQINTPDSKKIKLVEIPDKIFIVDLIENKAQQSGRLDDLIFDLDNGKPAINQQDFQNILNEIIENAFKFSQPGTPVTINSKAINHNFYLTISNQGRTMTDEEIGSIGAFRQFKRKLYEQQGIGLGLKIVAIILKIYGGKLSISNLDKPGTNVEIELPLAD
jgi:two-component system, sensor histidine kinase and response regulator